MLKDRQIAGRQTERQPGCRRPKRQAAGGQRDIQTDRQAAKRQTDKQKGRQAASRQSGRQTER